MNTHLTAQQRNDIALGTADAAASAHLAVCVRCHAEAEATAAALASFRLAAVRWSEQAAVRAWLPQSNRRLKVAAWPAWALAAVLLVGMAIPLARRQSPPPAAVSVEAQLSRDNQLLARIDTEIGASAPAALQPLQNVQ